MAPLAKRLGALPPEHIVVGLEPTFFVTEADVDSLDGTASGRTMYLSLPLCRLLTQAELSGVRGHELAHFRGLDTRLSQRFNPLYSRTREAIATLGADLSGERAVALRPVYHLLSFFLDSFAVAERTFGRERELAADRVAAKAAGGWPAAALIKLHVYAGFWDGAVARFGTMLRSSEEAENVSALFAGLAVRNMTPGALRHRLALPEPGPRHPTDTHPPLSDRLGALGQPLAALDSAAGAALLALPQAPAIALLPDHERLEDDLTAALGTIMSQTKERWRDAAPR